MTILGFLLISLLAILGLGAEIARLLIPVAVTVILCLGLRMHRRRRAARRGGRPKTVGTEVRIAEIDRYIHERLATRVADGTLSKERAEAVEGDTILWIESVHSHILRADTLAVLDAWRKASEEWASRQAPPA